jgi:hypothetical protein
MLILFKKFQLSVMYQFEKMEPPLLRRAGANT